MRRFEHDGILFGASGDAQLYFELPNFGIPVVASEGHVIVVRGTLSIPRERYGIPALNDTEKMDCWLSAGGEDLLIPIVRQFSAAFSQSDAAKSEAKDLWDGIFKAKIL